MEPTPATDPDPIAHRSVIVIGATGQIGQTVASSLHAHGYRLTLTYHEQPPAILPEALWMRADVADVGSIQQVAERSEAAFGVPYGLVYCAGVVRNVPVTMLKHDMWDEMLRVNLTGAFVAVQRVARSMMSVRRGRIVLIGSIASRMAVPGQAAYGASKAGLVAFGRSVAAEFGRFGVTCNVVEPGAIEGRRLAEVPADIVKRTIDQTPLRRLGQSSDVAGAVTYLLSDDAAFMTGQTLVVDGGLSR